jgi:hypothetical protein
MKITFAGLKTTGKVDTVWVVLELGKHQLQEWYYYDYVIAWGRRGGKLQSMTRLGYIQPNLEYNSARFHRYSTIGKLINKKLNKEYESISEDRLAEVYPDFEKDLDKLAFWETLKL